MWRKKTNKKNPTNCSTSLVSLNRSTEVRREDRQCCVCGDSNSTGSRSGEFTSRGRIGLFWWCASTIPLVLVFQLTDHLGGWGKHLCNRIIWGQKNKYIAAVLLEWYNSYLIYFCRLHVWQERSIRLEYSERSRALMILVTICTVCTPY